MAAEQKSGNPLAGVDPRRVAWALMQKPKPEQEREKPQR